MRTLVSKRSVESEVQTLEQCTANKLRINFFFLPENSPTNTKNSYYMYVQSVSQHRLSIKY